MPITVKGFKRATDAEGDRVYQWDGTDYPSVTTILKLAVPKPGLARWQAKLVAQAAIDESQKIQEMKPKAALDFLLGLSDQVKDVSSVRGSAVHEYAEHIAFGRVAPELTEEERKYADSFDRFLYDFAPVFTAVELPVFSDTYKYAGTVDIYAEIEGRQCVVDIKTGRSIWPEVALQLAAYANSEFAVTDNGRTASPTVERGYVLHVGPDKYDLRRVDIGVETFNVFLSALDIYNWHRFDSKYNIGAQVELPSDWKDRISNG